MVKTSKPQLRKLFQSEKKINNACVESPRQSKVIR